MHMLLKSKEVAFTGVMMALGVLLVTLGGYFEGSTLFFLAAASFLAGVVFRGISLMAALLFLTGTTFLGFILAPQKLYLATFFAFCVYVIAAECLERAWGGEKDSGKKGRIWAVKALLYHFLLGLSIYLVQKFFGLEILFSKGMLAKFKDYRMLLIVVLVLAAELLWLVFDRAYFYFQGRYGRVFQRLKQE